MGEVYRAKDTKLAREVAIKVLPAAFAQHPERLARFEREAKVLASLNHPNVATIYAVEESSDGKALVMELVQGETVKGPVPVETALKYAAQIASALDAAQEKGITHRDLKPANIMVTPDPLDRRQSSYNKRRPSPAKGTVRHREGQTQIDSAGFALRIVRQVEVASEGWLIFSERLDRHDLLCAESISDCFVQGPRFFKFAQGLLSPRGPSGKPNLGG